MEGGSACRLPCTPAYLLVLGRGERHNVRVARIDRAVRRFDSTDEGKCAPVTCRFVLVVLSCFEVLAIYLFSIVVPIAENFVLNPGASWEAVQLFPYYLHSPL